ncbi:winged helix-turn-helix domain-containing protein [Sphingomonas naphthae]|uniref:Winged helix-turn-helix domain-containing protein n=1 Tax=Sphingomonas naphthae TaxID=1813468 RepID=A0ABY7TP22_9SPHN|nr:winged helix-turn-helix domain-containing protein [Sphingomonas naphthae]WCT74977.1 winged helix-turn-helix domain-containing protein [Sphingomonas naphthae]
MRVAVQGDGPLAGRIADALRRAGLVVVAPEDAEALVEVRAIGRLRLGDAVVDLSTGLAFVGGKRLRLTRLEWALLAELHRAGEAGRDRMELIRAVWGLGFDPGTNIVAVHVARLRARIGRGAIECVEGRYRLMRGNGGGADAL